MPEGNVPAPLDGSLPPAALTDADQRAFGIYLHIPFCATRCGYCDFNTYTAHELTTRDGRAVVSQSTYLELMLAEIRMAQRVLGGSTPPVSTIFVGGGTPSLLPAGHLLAAVEEIDACFGIAADAEITTEANPESVSPGYLRRLREGGFTRISLGMQSAAESVLTVLDHTRTRGGPLRLPPRRGRPGSSMSTSI